MELEMVLEDVGWLYVLITLLPKWSSLVNVLASYDSKPLLLTKLYDCIFFSYIYNLAKTKIFT